MTRVDYRKKSPYSSTPQTSWYLDNLVLKNIPNDPTDTIMVLDSKYNERPDLLSHNLYGTRDYWWVFMVMNMDVIRDPIYDFKTGISIYVPTKDRLDTFVSSN